MLDDYHLHNYHHCHNKEMSNSRTKEIKENEIKPFENAIVFGCFYLIIFIKINNMPY